MRAPSSSAARARWLDEVLDEEERVSITLPPPLTDNRVAEIEPMDFGDGAIGVYSSCRIALALTEVGDHMASRRVSPLWSSPGFTPRTEVNWKIDQVTTDVAPVLGYRWPPIRECKPVAKSHGRNQV
eukprot:scpid53290/ scgid22787/ 